MSFGQRQATLQAASCTAERHGTPTAYDWWGCRCPEGREAWRIYRKRLRSKRQPPALIPAAGTTRRLQGLVALGWTWTALAERLGVTVQRTRQLAWADTVHRDNAAKVAALFELLSATPGGSKVARTVAARHGWVPPLAWGDDIDDPAAAPEPADPDTASGEVVDEVAVDRALAGEQLALTDVELVAAVQTGSARGMQLKPLAALLGLSVHSVKKMLSGGLSPREEMRQRVEDAIRAGPALSDYAHAKTLGVSKSTVTAARRRIAERHSLAS